MHATIPTPRAVGYGATYGIVRVYVYNIAFEVVGEVSPKPPTHNETYPKLSFRMKLVLSLFNFGVFRCLLYAPTPVGAKCICPEIHLFLLIINHY